MQFYECSLKYFFFHTLTSGCCIFLKVNNKTIAESFFIQFIHSMIKIWKMYYNVFTWSIFYGFRHVRIKSSIKYSFFFLYSILIHFTPLSALLKTTYCIMERQLNCQSLKINPWYNFIISIGFDNRVILFSCATIIDTNALLFNNKK